MRRLAARDETIRRLRDQVRHLREQLGRRNRTVNEEPFGSSTPSAKKPVKANTPEDNRQKRGGAVQGHVGKGRSSLDADADAVVLAIKAPERCPDCGSPLESRGAEDRSVLDLEPEKLQPVRYHLGRGRCPRCSKWVQAKAPGVPPKGLFGHTLLAWVAEQHYLHGHTMGDVASRLGLHEGSLHVAMHQTAARLEPAMARLAEDYRQAEVKHADETPWRTDGLNGYAWLFATHDTSLYRLRETRSADVPAEVLGDKPLPGVLAVDRYAAYNVAPCPLQYCYAHLLRDVQDLEREFPDNREVAVFTDTLIPLLSRAMKLHGATSSRTNYLRRAHRLKERIIAVCARPARHPGVQQIQGIFRENPHRLYHWADSPDIPADNNFAERDLRALVIARKISFGSQSEKGRLTREVLMSVLHTLRKRGRDPTPTLRTALDIMAASPQANPANLLFPRQPLPRSSPTRG
jgi:transposase